MHRVRRPLRGALTLSARIATRPGGAGGAQSAVPDSIPRLNPGDLQAADVLLYHGPVTDWFARAIQHFDDSLYFHAALSLDAGRVAEAVMVGGIDDRPLDETFGHREWALVRRYRAELLARPKRALDPVVACARDVVSDHQRYATEQLVPLAALLLTRKVPRTRSFGTLAVGVLRGAAAHLERLAVSGRHRHPPLVCSGLVAYCFASAPPKGSYALVLARPEQLRGPAGLDPESLLAEILAADQGGRLPGLRGPAPAEAPSLEELERLIAEYLEEVEGTPGQGLRAAGSPFQDLDEVAEAVLRFAEALYDFVGPNESASLHAGKFRRIGADPLAVLVELAGELVTPGDLARSPTLVDIGMLVPERSQRAAASPAFGPAARTSRGPGRKAAMGRERRQR